MNGSVWSNKDIIEEVRPDCGVRAQRLRVATPRGNDNP
jgi:hypothetical protein